jgi:hypothetical protein
MRPHPETAASPLPGGGGGPADVTNITRARDLIDRLDALDAGAETSHGYYRWTTDAYNFLKELTGDD